MLCGGGGAHGEEECLSGTWDLGEGCWVMLKMAVGDG